MLLPKGEGPNQVGMIDLIVENDSYQCVARIFYPLDPSHVVKDETFPPMIPDDSIIDGYCKFIGANFLIKFLFHRTMTGCQLSAIENGPAKEGSHPLMIFSHGLGGTRTTYSTMATYFASYGFVVACIEHRDESASCAFKVKFDDSGNVVKEWIFYNREMTTFHLRHQQVQTRVSECSALLNCLLDINKGSDSIKNLSGHDLQPLVQKIDSERVIMAGHSFGGATTLSVLAEDKRFQLGLLYDVWMFAVHRDDYSKVEQPLLFVNNEYFHSDENVAQLAKFYNESSAVKSCISVKGTVHSNHSDFSIAAPCIIGRIMKTRHSLDPVTAIRLNILSSLAFIKRNSTIDSECDDAWFDILDCKHPQMFTGTNPQMNPSPHI